VQEKGGGGAEGKEVAAGRSFPLIPVERETGRLPMIDYALFPMIH
jgi:hypothetical protein